jgi:hypothetical protein
MNDILDTPLRRSLRKITADERKFAERQERVNIQQNKVGFFDAAQAAFEKENSLSWFLNGLDEKDYEVDTSNWLDDDTFNELTEDLPVETWDYLDEARNLNHAKALRTKALESLDNEKTLQSYGWGGVGLRLGAAIIDPLAIGASVVTGGALGPAIWGSKATRLGNAFRGALGGAASNAAIESYLVSQDPVKDPYDILYGATAGLILGGAFGALAKTADPELEGAVAGLKKATENAQVIDYAEQMRRQFGDDPQVQSLLSSTALSTSANRWADDIVIPNKADDLITDFRDLEDAPFSEWSRSRIDFVGRGKGSKLNTVRDFFGRAGEDGVGFNRNNATMSATADIKKTILYNTERGKVAEVYNPAVKQRAKEDGVNIVERNFTSYRSKFGTEVSDQIENPRADAPVAVQKAAKAVALSFRELLRKAKDSGLKGFESIPENLRYFTHLWQPYKFIEFSDTYGQDNVVKLLKQSLLNGDTELDDELAQNIAEGMVRKIKKSEFGKDSGLARIFTTDEKDILKDILVEEEILTEDQAQRLINLFGRKPLGEPARAKRRLKIDVDAELTLPDGNILRVKDLMDRDAERVYDTYAQQLTGRIALAEVGIKSEDDFRKVIAGIKEEAKAKGLEKEAEAQIQNIEILYDLLLGRNPSSAPFNAKAGSKTARASRLIADYNFIRLMNQVGFAQVAEIGNIVSIGGVRGLIQAVPEFRSVIKRAKNGQLEDQVARDIVNFLGVGNERAINQAFNRFDPVENYVAQGSTFFDKAVEGSIAFMQPLKRVTADVSGMAPITLMLERVAARTAMQNITDAAFKSTNISAKRLAGLGLSEDMADKIFNQIKEHAVTVKSPFFKNQKLRQTNMEDWTDTEARDAFTVAVVRMTRRSIQQNDLGNLNKYMTGTMGKLILQFRTFMLVSYSKQTLHAMTARDLQTVGAFAATTLFAGSSYVAQTYVNSLGRDDKEEFLNERLNPVEIGKAAFQRSSYASMIPAAIDTAALFYTNEPVFAYGRSTGLASNLISGIPTVDLANKVDKVVRGGARSILNPDLQWSKSHQRSLNSLAFFNNAIGIRNGLNKLVDIMPESQRVD